MKRMYIIAAIELAVISVLFVIYYGIIRGILVAPPDIGRVQIDSLLALSLIMVFVIPLLSIYKWITGKTEREMELFRLSFFLGGVWGAGSWAIRDFLSTRTSIPPVFTDLLSFPSIFFGIASMESSGAFLLKRMIAPILIGGTIGFVTAYSAMKLFEGYMGERLE